MQNGQVNFKATTLCYYNKNWWYVQNGQVNFKVTTLCYYNKTWWYVQNSQVNFKATTLCYYNKTWWYVQNGQVNFKATTLCYYNKTWWYVQNGQVDFNYNGKILYNGSYWNIRNGQMVSKAENYTGITKDSNGNLVYYNNGALDNTYKGRVVFAGATFDVENGKCYVVGKNLSGYYNSTNNVYEVAYRTGNTSNLSSNDKAIVAGLSEFLQYAEQFTTLYEKEKAIHDYMVANCCYDEEVYEAYLAGDPFIKGENPYMIEGIFIDKTAVCDGYSKAFQLCMEILGIPCVRITGTADGGDHAWNAVQLDGEWYQVDVTWDDPIPDSPGTVYYSYFNITDEVMSQDHSYTWQYKATGTKYNYERIQYEEMKSQENFFDNPTDYYAYIQEQLNAGNTSITCYVDEASVDAVSDYLTYDNLSGWTRVSYYYSADRYYYTFYMEFELPYYNAA